MARARKKASTRGGNAGRGSTSSKSRKTKAAAAPEIEVVEEEAGMGMEDGIVILTTVILLTACLMVDYYIGTEYGAGMMFK